MSSPWKVFMDAFKKASTAQPEKPVVDFKSNGPMGHTYDTGAFDPIERPAPTSTPQADSQVTGVTDLGDAGMRSPDDGGSAAVGTFEDQLAVSAPAQLDADSARRLMEGVYSGDGGSLAGLDPELVAAVRLLPKEDVMGALDGAVVSPEPVGTENVAQEGNLGALFNQMMSNILKTQAEVANDTARNLRAREIPPEEDGGPFQDVTPTADRAIEEPGVTAAEPVKDASTQSGTPGEGDQGGAVPTATDQGPPSASEMPPSQEGVLEPPAALKSVAEDGGQAQSVVGGETDPGTEPASMLSWGTSRRMSDSRLRRDSDDDEIEDDESSTLLQLTPSRPGEGPLPGAGGSTEFDLDDIDGVDDVDDEVEV